MSFLRFQQAAAVNDPDFRSLVEASLMVVAYGAIGGDKADANYTQRVGLAHTLFYGSPERTAWYVRLFAWYAVNRPAVQQEAFSSGAFKASTVSDATIDAAVTAFWDTAAAVRQ